MLKACCDAINETKGGGMSSVSGLQRLQRVCVHASLTALCLIAAACTKQSTPASPDFKIERYANIKWSPALPGIEVAVLSGNPEASGQPYSMLIKCADGAGTKPHRHPTDGTAIVLQGTWLLGVGENYDSTKQQALTVGDYVYAPKNVAHFDACKGETVLYAHGIGPLEFRWVNPADDPTKASKPQ